MFDFKMKKVTINLDRLAEISLKGIQRTSVFMSFGINFARDKSLKDYQLSRETAFRIMPDNLGDDQIEEFKKHYEHWIISCGLSFSSHFSWCIHFVKKLITGVFLVDW